MKPGLNLALFLHAHHQSKVFLLKLFTTAGIGDENLQKNAVDFVLQFQILFQPTQEHNYSHFKEEIEYILVQHAKGKSDVDCLAEAYTTLFEGLTEQDKEKQKELLKNCLQKAISLVDQFHKPLIEAGKIWWERGYHKRQTIQLLGGCAHPEVKDNPDYTTTTPAIQKFLAAILNSSGEVETEYSEWLQMRARLQPAENKDSKATKKSIENEFEQFANQLKLGTSQKSEFLLWLLNNGALLRYYQFPATRVAIERDYLKTLENPGCYLEMLKTFETTINKFLKTIALHPATRSRLKEDPFALRVSDYSQQWVVLAQYKQLLDELFEHKKFRYLVKVSLFDSKKVHEWVVTLRKSTDPEEQAFCARLLPAIKILNYEPVDSITVYRGKVKTTKPVHVVADGKKDFPVQTFLTEETNKDLRKALLADQDPMDSVSLPQFLFMNPRLVVLLFEQREVLIQAAKHFFQWQQDTEEKAKKETGEILKNSGSENKEAPANEPNNKSSEQKKNPNEEKIHAFLAIIQLPQIRKTKLLVPMPQIIPPQEEQKKLETKTVTGESNTASEKKPCYQEQEIVNATFTYLTYLGALAQENFRFNEIFSIRFRRLIQEEGAQEDFARAVLGFNDTKAGITSSILGLVDVGSAERFGDQELLRSFLLRYNRIATFLLDNEEYFFKTAEIWNKTRSCQNLKKPRLRHQPTLPTIPEEKMNTPKNKSTAKLLFAKHSEEAASRPSVVQKPTIQEVEMDEDDLIIINVNGAPQCRA